MERNNIVEKKAVRRPRRVLEYWRGLILNLKTNMNFGTARNYRNSLYSARGMAFVDIAFLRRDDICGDWFSYVRRKTGQRLTVRIEPPMAAIINRYKNEAGEYVFPIISADGQDAYRQYQTALGYHNRKLKQLAEIAGISEKLSTYTARHSWATAARRHNVPLSIISAGLGHSSERTTLIYLDSVENVALDNANHEILKCL